MPERRGPSLAGSSRFARPLAVRASSRTKKPRPGFTLIELILVIVLLGILATIGLGQYRKAKTQARNAAAIAEVRMLTDEIDQYEAINGALPAGLADIGRHGLLDPWGYPYIYLNFGGVVSRKPGGGGGGGLGGKPRKDKNLVPLNSTYDIYSMGEDGASQAPLTVKVSHDDIIRANDGAYIGLAAGY